MTDVVEGRPRTADEHARFIAGTGPVLPIHERLGRTIADSLAALDNAALDRSCSTCVHIMQPCNWSPRCSHPLVAARRYDAVNDRAGITDVTCHDQRSAHETMVNKSTCGVEGRLHERRGFSVVPRRVASWWRARRFNLTVRV